MTANLLVPGGLIHLGIVVLLTDGQTVLSHYYGVNRCIFLALLILVQRD